MYFQGPVIRHALELAKAVPACRHQKLLPNVARWKVVSRGMAGLEHPVGCPGLGKGLAGKAYTQSIANLLQPRRPRIIPDRLLSRAGLYAFRSGQNRAPSGARSLADFDAGTTLPRAGPDQGLSTTATDNSPSAPFSGVDFRWVLPAMARLPRRNWSKPAQVRTARL